MWLRDSAAGGGQNEIAHSRQPGERRRLGAQGNAEARDLGQAARDQRGARVVAQAQALEEARGERDDVLERAGQLHAHHVGERVDAEHGGREGLLHLQRHVVVLRSRHDGRRLPLVDLLGE